MPRLLIVDDEESISFAMARYFRSQAFEVDAARELEEAQALIANYRYDAVIADLRLTGVHGAEGLDIVTWVRERCPWTRSILLTAYVSEELDAEARARGVDLVIRKPQSLPDLAQILMHLLGESYDVKDGR